MLSVMVHGTQHVQRMGMPLRSTATKGEDGMGYIPARLQPISQEPLRRPAEGDQVEGLDRIFISQ